MLVLPSEYLECATYSDKCHQIMVWTTIISHLLYPWHSCLVSTQQPEGTFQMLSHIMLTDHKTQQRFHFPQSKKAKVLTVILKPLYLALVTSNLISYFAASSHSAPVTLAFLLLSSKASFCSFKSLIKCLYLIKQMSTKPMVTSLFNFTAPFPYISPDHFLFCSFLITF